MNLVINDQEVTSIGRATYEADPLCLQCQHHGNHRINGGSASASWDLPSVEVYERQLSDFVSDASCYSGFIEAWGSAGFHDTKETIRKCAPCVLWTETDGSGSITGAPIGKSSYTCGGGITLTATPASGWRFVGWGGSISSQSSTITFTLDASKSLTAFFEDSCNQSCWTTCNNGNCPPPEDIQECTPYCSPLVLDISGDEIRTTGAEDPVLFDIDGDGTPELLGWLARNGDDAFLWRDVEKNRRVDDGSELFGIGMTLPDGRRASSGFEALAAYDQAANGGNEDGLITNDDAVWHRLLLWVDTNHNGISEKVELSPIQAAGVFALNLSWTRSSFVDAAGNQFRMVGSCMTRGARGKEEDHLLADVFFRVFR